MSETESTIRDEVRRRYAQAAMSTSSCCDTECCGPSAADAFRTADTGDFGTWLYESDELNEIPDGAALASLGCGNPTAVAELREG